MNARTTSPAGGAALAKQVCGVLLIAALPAGAWAWLHPDPPPMRRLAPEVRYMELMQGPQPVLLLDARPEADYFTGHLPGAILVNEDDWGASLRRFIEAWMPPTRIAVYCGATGCAASHAVAGRLAAETGIDNIVVISDAARHLPSRSVQ